MKQLHLQHLLWRAGFGPSATHWSEWENLSPQTAWQKLKADSAAAPEYFDLADNSVKGLMGGLGNYSKMQRDELDAEQKKQIRRQSKDDLQNLNLRWLEEMVRSRAQLREKMALFWHGHFAGRNFNILYQQQLLDVLRKGALGNFGDLLRAVSKSAAMLAFLNTQQNKKQHPNENFARELMELFTLGRGHYTETDIKEAARAFTGWGFKLDGTFNFRLRDHDTDRKTVLGQSDNFDGDAVLDILLQQKQTARHIVGKLYRFLVNENTAPDARIEWLATRFFENKYDISRLLDDIMLSDWFYERENIGTKIKSPIELWVGIRRSLPVELDDPHTQLLIQKLLGQILFYPPNVAGWPGAKNWIDSSSLMLRLRLPQLLALRGDLDVRSKDDDDQQMGEMDTLRQRQQRFSGQIDWEPVLSRFRKTPENELSAALARMLWQRPEAKAPLSVLESHIDTTTKDKRIQSTFIQLMATPEYQLC